MLWDSRHDLKVKNDPWRLVMRKAIDVIERFGWMQHADGNEKVGFCASQAMRYAAYDLELNLEYPGKAWTTAALKLTAWIHRAYIPDWNDASDQTKENVLLAMRSCADQPGD